MFDEDKLVTGRWIVGSIDKNTERLSVSPTPKVHFSKSEAINEARRLATKDTSKKFVALKLDGIARAADVVVE